MIVIRLARTGAKKNPFYHVVVTDKRNSRDGRFIERLGYFDPMARGKSNRLELNKERITYWVGEGAQPSDRVQHLLKQFEKTVDQPTEALPTRAQMRKEQREAAVKQEKAKAKAEAETKAAEEKAETEAKKAEEVKAEAEPKEEVKAEEAAAEKEEKSE